MNSLSKGIRKILDKEITMSKDIKVVTWMTFLKNVVVEYQVGRIWEMLKHVL